jgi:hypothetical protein
MTDIIATILSVIGIIPSFSDMINSQVSQSKGTKRSLILEMKKNAAFIQLYLDGEADLDTVIEKLTYKKLEKTLNSNFDFNIVKRGKVKEKSAGGIAFFEKYIGWTTEKLFENLYLKLQVLKTFISDKKHNSRLRKNVRLINILKLIKLIIIHIDE